MKKILSNAGIVSFCLLFSALHAQIKAQTRTITGVVTDHQKPLTGVTVNQEGTSTVTTTSTSGAFTLQITGENPVLIFRHPGYTHQKIAAAGKKELMVDMSEKITTIQEVILNAGYYDVKAKESTGSIARVTTKDIENQPVNNVLSALQGRMAGVSITQNSGNAGAGFDVQIRGRNSLRSLTTGTIDGNVPLYVIDGVVIGGETTSLFSIAILPMRSINPLNALNPNDIESIEVLKDADATAIYGSRGANGVILVTTKKAKKSGLELNINSSYSLSRVASKLDLLSTPDYLAMRRQAYTNDGITTYPANAYDVNGKWDPDRYTDWQKTLIGNTADATSNQFSLKGGSETTRFLLSAGHQEQSTVYSKGFQYKINTLSSNITHRSPDKKFNLSISNLFSDSRNNLVTDDTTLKSLLLSPNAPALYNEDDSLNWQNFTNPVAIYNTTYLNHSLQFLNNLATSYKILPGFQARLNAGLNYQNFEEWSLRPNTIFNPAFITGQSSAYSSSSKNNQSRWSLLLEPQLQYDLVWNRNSLQILLGGSFQRDTGDQISLKGSGFETNAFIQNIGAAQTKTISDQVRSEYRYAAVFSRLNYQWDHKYILNLTARRDGSSRFGENNRFADFGAIGAAWIFSKEKLFADSKWLSFGKLRGSYGIAGSDNIGDYQFLDTYALSGFNYNGTNGLIPSRLYNPDFSWEKTLKLEAALELGFFKDRLNLTATYYRNRSSNQLVGYQLPATTGFSSVLANLDATVENTGFEFELVANPVNTADFKWTTNFNLSLPRNKLLSFPGLEGSTYANTFVVGQPTNIVKLYELQGLDPQTGIYTFTDFNGDGNITTPEDNLIVERLGPRLFAGWSNSFQLKNWSFSFLWQAVQQRNYNYNATIPIPGGMFNQPVEVLNVWSPSNLAGTYMPYSTGANSLATTAHNNFRNSTASVSDASFIRLKNIQLRYQIPLRNSFINAVNIYVQGQNILTLTKYFGLDPEFSVLGYLPPLKTISFGTEFNF